MLHPNLLDQLQMFVTAAELGSFSATAKQLGRAHNVVSYGISTLEENLAVSLFDRSGHRAVLTPEGHTLRRQAATIVYAARDFTRRAEELSSGVESVLTLAVDEMVPIDLIEPGLATVGDQWPGLEIRMNRTAGLEGMQEVDSGRTDLGVGILPLDQAPKYAVTAFAQIRMVPVCHPDKRHEDISTFLASQRQIVLSGSEAPEASPDLGVFSPHIWRVPDVRSKLDLILRGLGWGNLPTHMVEDDLAAGRLTEVTLPFLKIDMLVPIFVYSLNEKPLGQAARLFRDRIIESVGDPG